MKLTLLEIVQEILNDISGDEVDSISDTTEATQVANIVKSTYNHLVSHKDLPLHKVYFQLEITSSSTPTMMTIPTDIIKVYWIDYDRKADPGAFSGGAFSGSGFDTGESSFFTGGLEYVTPSDFFQRMGMRVWDNSTTLSYTYTSDSGDTFEVKYKNDKTPTFYTILNNRDVLFDSIDTDINADYLEADDSWAYGLKEPTFTLSDAFTPDLDELEFNWLIEEAKSASSIKLRQVDDPVASRRARRGMVRSMSNNKNDMYTGPLKSLPDYGRK